MKSIENSKKVRTSRLAVALTLCALLAACGAGMQADMEKQLERAAIFQARKMSGDDVVKRCDFLRGLPTSLQERIEPFLGVTRAQCGISTAAPPLAGPPQPSATTQVKLPIEVIGPDGYTERVQFNLTDAASIDRLYIQCHRCAYRDSSVNKDRGAKGSVRLNQGAWVDLDDKTATVQQPDKSYGGIAGAFHTVRFTVPIEGAVAGNNTLEFRFNKTDGHSSGYRVLAFNVQRSGQSVLPASAFVDDDPQAWAAPLAASADIDEGKRLWSTATLKQSPLSDRTLKAACASCHAADGRDLKYFNYSNWSIQERAKFHGLNDKQGQQIASYLRTLDAPAPGQARPWNPPYQPGPGLDSKPVQEWAAGAGLQAVLASDKDMLSYLFPNGTAATEIAKVADLKGTLNIRELPVPLQLPDWNDWLPDVHPLDLWGDAFANSDAPKGYKESKAALAADATQRIKDKRAIDDVESMLTRTWAVVFEEMSGPVPCPIYADNKKNGEANGLLMDKLPADKTCEDGLQAVNHWLAVKNWELFQTYNLEEAPRTLYPYGEKRGWFGKQRNVFEVASHRSADNSQNFRHQSTAMGSYHSNAWYHVQMILNAGNRDPYTFFPQDWFYTPMFIALNARDNRQPLALLNTAMHIKMYQNLDMTGPDGKGTDRGADYDGWWLPFVTPWRFESTVGWEETGKWNGSISADGKTSRGFPWTYLDQYEPGLRVKVTNQLLRNFVTKQKSYSLSSLKRRSATVSDSAYFEAADYVVPTDVPGPENNCFYPCPGGTGQAQPVYRALVRFKEMGVDSGLRGELIDYMKALFPRAENNWDALR